MMLLLILGVILYFYLKPRYAVYLTEERHEPFIPTTSFDFPIVETKFHSKDDRFMEL